MLLGKAGGGNVSRLTSAGQSLSYLPEQHTNLRAPPTATFGLSLVSKVRSIQ